MADKPTPQTPVSPADPVPLVENVHAPFLYFDGAPNFGIYDGICNITLEAVRYQSIDGKIEKQRVIVAHLRMGPSAALSLKGALEGILLLVAPTESDAKN